MRAGRFVQTAWSLVVLTSLAAANEPRLAPSPEPPRPVQDYDEPPRLRRQTKPKYPESAFQRRLEGVVEVEFVIGEDGRVLAAHVIKPKEPPKEWLESATNDLYEAALACVREWEFEPARKEGRPVATVARAPVGFRIWGDKKKKTPTPTP